MPPILGVKVERGAEEYARLRVAVREVLALVADIRVRQRKVRACGEHKPAVAPCNMQLVVDARRALSRNRKLGVLDARKADHVDVVLSVEVHGSRLRSAPFERCRAISRVGESPPSAGARLVAFPVVRVAPVALRDVGLPVVPAVVHDPDGVVTRRSVEGGRLACALQMYLIDILAELRHFVRECEAFAFLDQLLIHLDELSALLRDPELGHAPGTRVGAIFGQRSRHR